MVANTCDDGVEAFPGGKTYVNRRSGDVVLLW